MKKELLYFAGLYGDLNVQHGVNYIFSELIKTRSKTFDWVIRPHIHNQLYQIFCVESGEVIFQGSPYEKKLKGPFIILVPPMVVHGLSYSKDIKGRILTLSETYVETAFPVQTSILGALNKPEFIDDFSDKYKFSEILELILRIDREIFLERLEQSSMLHALICQLFISLYRMFNSKYPTENQDSLYLIHFNKFQKMLKSSGKLISIKELALKLKITPIHLNRICKTITHKSALEMVHEQLVREAEKYLRHTSLTVSEIAYLLNFEYPNYFSKVFKKHNKITPLQYRNEFKTNKFLVH